MCGRGAFVGRNTVVRALTQGLTLRRAFLLCGGPRTGRTSTLFEAARVARERWAREPGATKVVPVYFDLAALSQPNARTVAPSLWEAICAAVRVPEVHGGAVPPKRPITDFKRAPDVWALLCEAARQMWASAAGTGAWCRWALFVDGGDLLFDARLDGLSAKLFGLLREDESWAPSSLVVAGGRLLYESLFDARSPHKGARPLLLGALKPAEGAALVRAGLPDLPADERERLLCATGRHPYLLQRALAELLAVGPAGLDAAVAALAGEAGALFDRIWEEFDLGRGVVYRGAYAAPEHALMQLLLDSGAAGCDIDAAERELNIRPLKEFGDFLEYAGVAERVLGPDRAALRPQLELWNGWYAERILR